MSRATPKWGQSLVEPRRWEHGLLRPSWVAVSVRGQMRTLAKDLGVQDASEDDLCGDGLVARSPGGFDQKVAARHLAPVTWPSTT